MREQLREKEEEEEDNHHHQTRIPQEMKAMAKLDLSLIWLVTNTSTTNAMLSDMRAARNSS